MHSGSVSIPWWYNSEPAFDHDFVGRRSFQFLGGTIQRDAKGQPMETSILVSIPWWYNSEVENFTAKNPIPIVSIPWWYNSEKRRLPVGSLKKPVSIPWWYNSEI